MKCFRLRLSERRDVQLVAMRRDSPRHYCQRRLADLSLDEQEWLKRYTPERYHLESDSIERDESPPETPSTSSSSSSSSPRSDVDFRTNEQYPVRLKINNLQFPDDVDSPEVNPKPRRTCRSRYRSVPKDSSARLHRMFVMGGPDPCDDEDDVAFSSRASSRASSGYDCYEDYEEYFRELRDECCQSPPKDAKSNNNNNENTCTNRNQTRQPDTETLQPIAKPKECHTQQQQQQQQQSTKEPNRRREKRKSITLSRIPSPETVQVIRIDVITGYPVSEDSLVSEPTTADDKSSNEGCTEENREADTIKSDPDTRRVKLDFLDCERLLHCRSVNLTERLIGGFGRSYF